MPALIAVRWKRCDGGGGRYRPHRARISPQAPVRRLAPPLVESARTGSRPSEA